MRKSRSIDTIHPLNMRSHTVAKPAQTPRNSDFVDLRPHQPVGAQLVTPISWVVADKIKSVFAYQPARIGVLTVVLGALCFAGIQSASYTQVATPTPTRPVTSAKPPATAAAPASTSQPASANEPATQSPSAAPNPPESWDSNWSVNSTSNSPYTSNTTQSWAGKGGASTPQAQSSQPSNSSTQPTPSQPSQPTTSTTPENDNTCVIDVVCVPAPILP